MADDPALVAVALAVIPNNPYEGPKAELEKWEFDWVEWKNFGMAVWGATGGSAEGFAAFDSWSQKNEAKYSAEGTRKGWEEISNSPPDRICTTVFSVPNHLSGSENVVWANHGPSSPSVGSVLPRRFDVADCSVGIGIRAGPYPPFGARDEPCICHDTISIVNEPDHPARWGCH